LRRVDRHCRHDADLAAAVTVENAIRLSDEARDRQRIDPLIKAAIHLFVHLERDFPERAALFAANRLQVVDHETGVRDHEQHLREAPRLVHRLDHQDFRNLHAHPRAAYGHDRGMVNHRESVGIGDNLKVWPARYRPTTRSIKG
jgi:hypothetical protein